MNKNIVKIIAVAAGAVSILACNKVSTYTPAPYAVIDSRSIEVEESEAGKLIQIPVYVYNRDGECSVTYTFEEGSAKNGKHFTPANTSGVLNFPAGTDTLAIEVKVIGEPGTYTGNQDFTVKLKDATNEVAIAPLNACKVVIKDLDHPLSALFGTYTISGLTITDAEKGSLGYPKWDLTLSAVEGEPDKILADNLTPFAAAYGSYLDDLSVVGTVSKDMKTIVFSTPQTSKSTATPWGLNENFVFYAHEGTSGGYIAEPAKVTFTYDEASKAWTTNDCYGFSTPSDIKEYTVFTNYTVVFSTFNANYPTVFVKK